MFFKSIFYSIFLFTIAHAGPGADFMRSVGDNAIKTLVNPDKSDAKILTDFENLYASSFAEEALLKFFVGESKFDSMNDAQKARLQSLIRRDLSMSYAKRFKEYRGLKFEVKDDETISNDPTFGTIIKVESKILHSGKDIPVTWILTQTPRIVDIKVEGLSMIQTKRKDYQATLNASKGDVEAFIVTLENNIKARSAR